MVLILGGCGQVKYPELPDDAIAFEMGEYIDKEDDDAAYANPIWQDTYVYSLVNET